MKTILIIFLVLWTKIGICQSRNCQREKELITTFLKDYWNDPKDTVVLNLKIINHSRSDILLNYLVETNKIVLHNGSKKARVFNDSILDVKPPSSKIVIISDEKEFDSLSFVYDLPKQYEMLVLTMPDSLTRKLKIDTTFHFKPLSILSPAFNGNYAIIGEEVGSNKGYFLYQWIENKWIKRGAVYDPY